MLSFRYQNKIAWKFLADAVHIPDYDQKKKTHPYLEDLLNWTSIYAQKLEGIPSSSVILGKHLYFCVF